MDADESQPNTKLMHSPATIQPIVPHTRMLENSPRRIAQLAKCNGIHQRQCRHVKDHVNEQQRVERREGRGARHGQQQHAAHQMGDREHALGVEIAVGNQPENERAR